jgi:hypothetical protein
MMRFLRLSCSDASSVHELTLEWVEMWSLNQASEALSLLLVIMLELFAWNYFVLLGS